MVRFVRLMSLSLAATVLLPTMPLAATVHWLAQVPAEIELPASIAADDRLRIDGDPSLTPTNAAVADNFSAQYPNASVQIDSTGSDAAIQALQAGEIDIAALGRPLTEAESANNLVSVPFDREKIAIIIGPDNPFAGDLTFEQFAQIFRGEVTDWSEIGGAPGPIRFVARPDSSDTRPAFQNYPVFQAAPFETGATAAAV
ncbi:MAG: substrate-binding domain-containing protein, partial [Cyanobacteria bacterium P01_A01_bin.105]